MTRLPESTVPFVFAVAASTFSLGLATGAAAERTVIAGQDFEGNTLSRGIPADRFAVFLDQFDPATGVYDIPGLGFDSGVGLGWTTDFVSEIEPGIGTAPDDREDNGDVIGVFVDDSKDWGTTNGVAGAPGQTRNHYIVEDADGTWTVTFDTFDTAGFTDLELSFTWAIDNDGGGVPAGPGSNFEEDDFIDVTVNGTSVFRKDGAGDFSAGDAAGGLDDLDAPYINAFAPETIDLSAFDGETVEIAFAIANNIAPEDIAFDSVSVSGVLAALLPADFNGNGSVEQADLDLVLTNWGGTRGFEDGVTAFATPNVDQEELDLVLTNWGSSAVPSFGRSNLPEPAAAIGLGFLGLMIRLRRPREKPSRVSVGSM